MVVTPKSTTTNILMGTLLLAVGVWGYFVCVRDPIFLNFDQADMALVARNLLRGNGFMTDAMWLWIRDWGSPRHPEDVWPLLQPALTAVSFLLLGMTVAAQKAVGVAFLMALLVTVYLVAKRLFGPWQGLIAAALVLPNARIPELAAYGLNDIGAAFLCMAALYAIYRSFEKDADYRFVIVAAVCTGFAVLQKFQAIFLVIAYVIWQLAHMRQEPRRVLVHSVLFIAVLAAVGLPLMLRNWHEFRQITYPTSSLIDSMNCAWDPFTQRWRGQMVYYNVYWEHEKPTYRYLLKHRGAKYLFLERPLFEVKRPFKLLLGGVIMETPLLIFGLLGIMAAWKSQKTWVKWNGVAALASLAFILFRSVEPRYYLFLVPMAAVLAAQFLVKLGTWLKEIHWALLVLFSIIVLAIFVYPARKSYYASITRSPEMKRYVQARTHIFDFLKSRLQPGEGVFNIIAADIAFHVDCPATSIPNLDLARFIQLADRYKLRYVVLNNAAGYARVFDQPGTQYWLQRQLAPLFVGKEVYGFKLELSEGSDQFVYRVPRPNEVDLDSLPKLPPEPDDFTRILLPPSKGGITEAPPPLE